jgi:hypothetical protein
VRVCVRARARKWEGGVIQMNELRVHKCDMRQTRNFHSLFGIMSRVCVTVDGVWIGNMIYCTCTIVTTNKGYVLAVLHTPI